MSPKAKKASRAPRKKAIQEDEAVFRANGVDQAERLRFIDLFCGIGRFRLGFEKSGAECFFSSDWDKFSQQTYESNFGERPHGDIHSLISISKVSELLGTENSFSMAV